jgi:tight adherence protein C
VRARQNKIRKGLPDALDMLSVCAEAGLGFDQAMQRVSEYWKTPVGIEFGRVIREMEMGLSRQEALRNLAERLDITELSSFVAVIIQSDELGMSIADTLQAQAKQMREDRRFRAQEQARKAPLKMLFPMMLLILPAMFAIVLGPTIPTLSDFFSSIRAGLY